MQITNRFFTGQQHLVFKVMQTAFDSDPDIFISKINQQPKSASDAQWYCMKSGSDTCVVRNTDINYGDNFYIGIRCINPCTYNLRGLYVQPRTLKEGERTQMRLDGQSSSIYEYYIPSDSTSGFTSSVLLTVESENPYSPMDLYLSTDKDLYQIEERKNQLSIQNGKAYRFTANDYEWCTKCFVYLLLDVVDTGRYYITGSANSGNDVLLNTRQIDRVTNARTQDCFQYNVEKNENDIQIISYQHQGNADIYISPRVMPNGIKDNNVKMISERSPWRTLIVTSKDRQRYKYGTGLYYFCLYPYIDTSMRLQVNEANQNLRYDATDGMLYTFNIENGGYIYFRYTSGDFTKRTTLNFQLQAPNINLTADSEPPRIFYKVCSSQNAPDCYLEVAEGQGKSATMQEVGVFQGNLRTGSIYHNPQVCSNVNSCYYLITCYYAQSNGPQKVSFKIQSDKEDPQDVKLETSYRNIMRQDSYFYYQLIPGSSIGHPYTDAIIIDLISYNGDADIFVSTTQKHPTQKDYEYSSQNVGDAYEKIILNRTSYFSLNTSIYISVYSFVETAYELVITPIYTPTYNEKLEKAEPLEEGIASYKYFKTEFEEAFYRFNPWWPSQENRTIVFVGDVIFNKIFFYIQKNDYPQFYFTDLQDVNDVIAITPNNVNYDRLGQYYIRVRPDFQLQDLISKREYIFNFYAFSQLPDNTYTDLAIGQKIFGYCNNTLKHYRHYILSRNNTYQITVKALQGKPQIYVKLSNQPALINVYNISSYDFKIDSTDGFAQIDITYLMRVRNNFDCDKAGYAYNGGNGYCAIYFGVSCQGQCIYNVSMSMISIDNKTNNATVIPQYIVDNEYATGKVGFNETQFFYYPIHQNNTGEMALLLNKTGPLDKNGDTIIMTWLQNDTSVPFYNWTYPSLAKANSYSFSNQSTQTELIEFCDATFQKRCANSSCTLVIGVLGITKDKTSHFRLTAYSRKNKLFDKQPVSGFIEKAGSYQYFWFLNNLTVTNSTAYWEYSIATSLVSQGTDVDLYVSAMDGRRPTYDDNDWFSNNVGPDDVFISSKDLFFQRNSWNTSLGMLFVVGVRALSDNTNFTLMMSGPKKYSPDFIDLTSNVPIVNMFNNRTLNTTFMHTYKWYNWGSKDFRIQLECQEGQVQMLFNYIGETIYYNDAYLAVPMNRNNSRYSSIVNAGESDAIRILKSDIDIGYFCYYCIYYVTVLTNNTKGNSTYRVSIAEMADIGDDINQINLGEPHSLTIPATGATVQRKFILDNKSPFTISLTLSVGYAVAYIGLYPEAPLSKFAWKGEGGVGTFSIRVRTTDPNFHLGAYYYITIQATQGRAQMSLRVQQDKTITQLDNTIQVKDLFWTIEERVKLYYFMVPTTNFTVNINIISLSEDFYPQLYFYRNNLTQIPTDLRTLTYPTMKTYTQKMGDNFVDLINTRNMTFILQGSETTQYTYYTMALYQFSYGMTDRRKSQFKLQLTIQNSTKKIMDDIDLIELTDDEQDDVFLNKKIHKKNNSNWITKTYEYYSQLLTNMMKTVFFQ